MDADVAVIGAGLTGTAVARALARWGARVLLYESRDLGSGADLGAIDLAALGLDPAPDESAERLRRDAEAAWMRAAPHLAMRVPVLAVAPGPRRGLGLLARWDAALSGRADLARDRAVLDAAAAHAREPALVVEPGQAALLTDRVRIDGPRLVVAQARDALEHGAELRLPDEVTALEPIAAGVRVVSSSAGVTRSASVRAAVVCTGATPLPGLTPSIASARRVHLVIGHALGTHAIAVAGASVVPFHGLTIVSSAAVPGTPEGRSADRRVTRDEVRALVAALGHHVPSLRTARIVETFASVRRTSSTAGLVAPIFGLAAGAPTSAAARASDVARRVASALGLKSDALPDVLPGGEEKIDSFDVAERMTLPEAAARRLVLRHGARVLELGARLTRRRIEATVVCACEPVLEAEIRHAVRAESARDVGAVARRTQLGLGACGGMRCAHRAAEIVCAERALAPSEAHAMTTRFLGERWQARAPALDPASLAQEELAHARWAASDVDAEESPR